MNPRDYGLDIIPGLGPVPMLPNPYGLGDTYKAQGGEPAPIRIGPVSLPLYRPAEPLPPMAPQAGRAMAGPGEAFRPTPTPVERPPTLPDGTGNVVPFRATNPVAPQQTPQTDAAGNPVQRQFPVVGKDISIQALTALQRKAESTNNYTATNKTTSASGAYQYTDGTWNNYGGYKRALYAPPAVQDKRFAEDIARRVTKYNGDVFKAIAEHYLPAAANKPETWNQPFRMRSKGKVINVPPVATYVRHVLKGTPLEKQLDAYLQGH